MEVFSIYRVTITAFVRRHFFGNHYFLTQLCDLREGRSHILYFRFILQMHYTLDTNTLHQWCSQSHMFLCSKDAWIPCCEGMSAVSLSVMFTEQWMSGTKSEVYPAAIHSCQQDFRTRTLLLHAGRVFFVLFCFFVEEWKLFYCTDYFNTVMLSLWHVDCCFYYNENYK